MRALLLTGSLLALAACEPSVPDSGAGVGFGGADAFRQQQSARDAQLTRTIADDQTQAAVDAVIPGPGLDLDAQVAAGNQQAATTSQGATSATSASTAAPGISDEQSFEAVAGRETIESDAARMAAKREQFQVVQPGALPTRTGSGPNIVAYALRTTNALGQSIYRRSGFTTQNRHLRNCADYASADLAQQAFLAAGGPERDRRGLDPDGDGFACRWDPTPFRAVSN